MPNLQRKRPARSAGVEFFTTRGHEEDDGRQGGGINRDKELSESQIMHHDRKHHNTNS